MDTKYKALLIPYNSKGEMYIQDRTGHKPPPWGFFGGTIEEGESPIVAMIRETKEELDLIDLGDLPTVFDGITVHRNFFLYRTNQEKFTVLEGAGGKWVSFEEAKAYLAQPDKVEELERVIISL